jgi:hypothetical protein
VPVARASRFFDEVGLRGWPRLRVTPEVLILIWLED